MKKWAIAIIAISFLTVLPWVISEVFNPVDYRTVGDYEQNPGYKTYVFSVEDVNGNYEGNFLKIQLKGDVDGIDVGGCHIWPADPNYLTIDNAVADVNDSNTTLYGSFTVSKVWGHKRYAIGVHLFDSYDNNDLAVGYVEGKDRGQPKVKKFENYNK